MGAVIQAAASEWALISKGTIPTAAVLDFVGDQALYDAYRVTLKNATIDTDNRSISMRGLYGGVVDSVGNYRSGLLDINDWDTAATSLPLIAGLGNAANEDMNADILMYCDSGSKLPRFEMSLRWTGATGQQDMNISKRIGRADTARLWDGLRIYPSTANFNGGKFEFWGRKK